AKLHIGDVIYADSGDAVHGGCIVKTDPKTGEQAVISSGDYLQLPFQPVIDAAGQIIVSDSGRLIRINPETGSQRIISDQSHGLSGLPYGIAVDRDGTIFAANLQAIARIDVLTGQVLIVSAGGDQFHPLALALANDGRLFVINAASPRQIIRINPQSGTQRIVSQSGLLKNPQAIAVNGNDLYVTDVATTDGNFGVGRVIHVSAESGAQRVLSEGGALVGPVGIAMDLNGKLIVGDPYTINP